MTDEAMRRLEEAGILAPDGAELLEDIVFFLKRWIVFQKIEEAYALALWVIHTYALEATDTTPYIWITSPAPSSGKSRLAEALEYLVHAPLRVGGASTAAVFREIEKSHPTLLMDEVDTKFGTKASQESAEDMRGLINQGFDRGTPMLRCVGPHHDTKLFDVYCPKVLIGLGEVPATVQSRSIPVRLQRKSRTENQGEYHKLRRRKGKATAQPLRDGIEKWVSAHLVALKAAVPSVPEELEARQQDAWECLLAIADQAGGVWPKRAREAAVTIHTGGDGVEATLGIQLLAHMKDALGDAPRLSTADLLEALVERDDAPWAQWWGDKVEAGGKSLNGPASRLARIIRPFGIKAEKIWFDDGTKNGVTIRGFKAEDLKPVFERYLSPTESESPDPPEKSEGWKGAGQSVVSDESRETEQAPDQGPSNLPTSEGYGPEEQALKLLTDTFHTQPIGWRRSQ
jgi:hypothetical protein